LGFRELKETEKHSSIRNIAITAKAKPVKGDILAESLQQQGPTFNNSATYSCEKYENILQI
jgi:hypothetical protein